MAATAELTQERRRLPREQRCERVLVQFTRRNPALGFGPVLRGHTVDISETGIQLVSCVPMPARSLLQLWIAVDSERKYVLSGETRWRLPIAGGNAYRSGIALHTDRDDFPAWEHRFRRGAQVLLFPWRRVGDSPA
jgi:hypothetical protein